jgi:radical SAM superfamily enzyme YgiQ (UPF0313 family)
LLAAKLREINPAITIIYGGNHVSHQGEAFFQSRTFADVLVNGEGEATFHELLQTYLDRRPRPDFSRVSGVSFRSTDGSIVTTPPRDRIKDLTIPSPYGAVLDATPANCRTALLETNRMPAFARIAIGVIGRRFTRSRSIGCGGDVWLARRQIDSYICDANFGILPQELWNTPSAAS